MWVARSFAPLWLALAAAGTVVGAEPSGSTLNDSKSEIRQLQSDQKNKAAQGGEKLSLGTPVLDVPQGSDSAALWLKDKLAQEKKLKQREKPEGNWLVDGVDKLEREEQAVKSNSGNPAKRAEPVTDTRLADQSDPQYLLKIFDDQKKAGDQKSSGAKGPSPTAPDPLAPFLQRWLGTSPARGQFFDQFVKPSDAGVPASGASVDFGIPPPSASSAPIIAGDSPSTAEKGNPYLAQLEAPILGHDITTETAQAPSLGPPSVAADAGRSGTVVAPEPATRPPERAKAPLPGLADDKKYFPQLKRF